MEDQREVIPSVVPGPEAHDRQVVDLKLALDECRKTNQRLNRRCQEAEAIANQKLAAVRLGILEDVSGRPSGRTLGRMLANYAASGYHDALADLVEAIDKGLGQEVALAKAREWLRR